MTNPLLSQTVLPNFSAIKPEHIKPAITSLIDNMKEVVNRAVAQKTPTWQNLVEAIAIADNTLGKAWSPVSHMNSVVNTEELRAAHDECLPMISEFSTWMGQHSGLYEQYNTLKNSAEYQTFSASQQKVIENSLLGFTLSGIALAEDKKQRFGEIQKALSQLSSSFSNNVLDATKAYSKLVLLEAELQGLPESSKAAAKQAAQKCSLDGWLFTLDVPSYMPVMAYCDNQALRQELHSAFITKASDQGPNAGDFDNSKYMDELLALKHEQAQLLGYSNYAELSLAKKMAESTSQVTDFLNELADKSYAQAQGDVQELTDFAKANFDVSSLAPWDFAYYSEKLKQARYAISDEELKSYFPEEKVLSGLFTIVNKLFGIEIVEVKENIETWHSDVRFFKINDKNGQHRGSFYLDLYARTGKRGGAWMAGCVNRAKFSSQEIQSPVAYLTCNFSSPVGDKPALFTHKEVVVLFHEFGHGIHHMLTQVDEIDISGINGVAWDAVELPSQFLENWCWQEEALSYISGHYETGETLPQAMLDKMLAAKNFQSAMQMVRQLEFALFDFKIHSQSAGNNKEFIQEALDEVRKQVAVTPVISDNRFQHSFSHIFAGGYSAGYYSYKWAEVLSADAFSKFEEEGIFNSSTGRAFLNCILEKGGSQEPMELFKVFRGREPNLEALLRHSNIVN